MPTALFSPRDSTQPWPAIHDAACANRNLCDLFIDELAVTLAGGKQSFRGARELHHWLPNSQPVLREAAERMAEIARNCVQEVTEAMQMEDVRVCARAGSVLTAMLAASVLSGPAFGVEAAPDISGNRPRAVLPRRAGPRSTTLKRSGGGYRESRPRNRRS